MFLGTAIALISQRVALVPRPIELIAIDTTERARGEYQLNAGIIHCLKEAGYRSLA